MNKNAKIGLYAVGGLFGFGLAYIAFALMLGVQPHAIPVAGAIFPSPPEEKKPESAPVASAPVNTTTEVAATPPKRPMQAGLLDVFQIESPYSGQELENLVGELKRKSKELDQRLLELGDRERRATERAEFLDEQYAELQRLRNGLESWENELELRQGEVDGSEKAREERELAGWVTLGKLFGEGDAAEQGKRLAQYPAADAAKILHTLKPARAKELLDNIGGEKWKEYAEAFRSSAPKEQP